MKTALPMQPTEGSKPAIRLRLLVVQQRLTEQAASEPANLDQRITGLEHELADAALGATPRGSKAATLELLLRRRDNRTRRGQSTAEIEADLARIEAQVDLAAENAALDGRPAAVLWAPAPRRRAPG